MKMLQFSQPQHGWIEIEIRTDHGNHKVVASDVPNDCIRELVEATVRLLSGSGSEQVQFSLEPDYATWRLQRLGLELRVAVLEPKDVEPVFEASFPVVAFAKRLAFECKRIQPSFAKVGAWSSDYPRREVDCLETLARDAEPAAAPNGGPTSQLGKSGVTEGPPSVS